MSILDPESIYIKCFLAYILFKFVFNDYDETLFFIGINRKIWEYYNFFTASFKFIKEIIKMSLDHGTNGKLLEDIFKDQLENNDDEKQSKKEVKYEDKYLDEIRKMNKEFEFTEEEKDLEKEKFYEFYSNIKNSYINSIIKYKEEIEEKEKEILDIEDEVYYNEEDVIYGTAANETKKESYLESIESYKTKIEEVQKILLNDENNIEKMANEQAKQYVIDIKLDKMKDNYVMEKTPLGNVLMVYNNKRGSFVYYSDNTIPYRYLETVARKYIKFFDCRPIYVDMEEELRLYEEKIEKDNIEKEERKKEENNKKTEENQSQNNNNTEKKKNVFAKFKSYNKEAGSGRVNTAPPPKNSIPNINISSDSSNTNEKILLKERANRYTYEGKFANFNFLKKVDRKIVDKKYSISFAEFKKMQTENKK